MNYELRFKSKKIAVIGVGVEGKSSAKWLRKHGAKVTLLDQKDNKNYLKNLDQYDIIVRSAGVKRSVIEQVLPKGSKAIITSQTKLFFDLCPSKIIGVTGTKGKGTTATLIYEMLKKDLLDAYLGGNIGKPPLDFLDTLSSQSVVVLELSSFQLLDLTRSPHIAVVLMITSEHLDYHADTNEYVHAKQNLIRFQTKKDFSVINKDYPASRGSDIHTEATVFQVSREGEVENGCFVRDGKIIVRAAPDEIEIIDIKDILLPGKHNLENACAAVMAALCASVSKQSITLVLKTFQGLPHRLELAGEINGVRYYDDSFSTTPETAIAAIEAFDAPKILILGGSSKNSDFTKLGEVIYKAKNIRAIIGIGVEWERIKSAFSNQHLAFRIVEGCSSMKEIVRVASDMVKEGDVVLLSPACASFDMFKNYKDRGEQFKKEVNGLKRSHAA
ncbi:MAG: UDP-N-acetylmuramoylalanine--D-glutamate ligase [Candidatus Levybacteria bacterium RIFCSPLOWO2_01_FULL_42_15]|nr:MAG: UDP-N-acetylmuramoylalanine--D-glutamate ligase [Candidatus Levybacteria bacterium RIFCSPLOWO2_01_FULL_42_15]